MARLARETPISGDKQAVIRVDAGRITARTTHSDMLAARLLALGATDLEITAPTLETAFTSLTEDAS